MSRRYYEPISRVTAGHRAPERRRRAQQMAADALPHSRRLQGVPRAVQGVPPRGTQRASAGARGVRAWRQLAEALSVGPFPPGRAQVGRCTV